MLQHVHVKDLVIVRSLKLDLGAGMTALTGETGAGKSILIDALGIALGAKADREMIRAGCEKAEVSAVFDISNLAETGAWLEQKELDSGGECILRRVLSRNGRSRAFINGSPVPIVLLKELGDLLVDIHGQHEHQSLLRPTSQRRLLDGYAGNRELLEKVYDCYSRYRQARSRLDKLRSQAEDRSNRIDYLEFQINELRILELTVEELSHLEQQQVKLANAEQLRQDTSSMVNLLYETDDSVHPVLSRSAALLDELVKLDPVLQDGAEMLANAQVQVEETVTLLRNYIDSSDFDPGQLVEVDNRLSDITQIARKHRLNPRELPDHLLSLEKELHELTHADTALAKLESETGDLEREYSLHADKLSKSRRQAATRLAKSVSESMQDLGMKQGRFTVELTSLPEHGPTAHGRDQVTFLVSANPGQPVAPLAKVASGGELSRISLIIQVATAGYGEVPTLIFDEVDVGIGGAVAETVGKLLRKLGNSRQVLCVTHLPQVASVAHHHLQVDKKTDGTSTETRIRPLDDKQRIQEIARMLGGIEITKQTLAHASEMIDRSRQNPPL